MTAAILVAVMAAATFLLRFLPFLIFREKTPQYITYLGQVLPTATIGMLVIYCFKDISIFSAPFGIPELTAAVCVIGLQIWKRNLLISILGGTVFYMILVQTIV